MNLMLLRSSNNKLNLTIKMVVSSSLYDGLPVLYSNTLLTWPGFYESEFLSKSSVLYSSHIYYFDKSEVLGSTNMIAKDITFLLSIHKVNSTTLPNILWMHLDDEFFDWYNQDKTTTYIETFYTWKELSTTVVIIF